MELKKVKIQAEGTYTPPKEPPKEAQKTVSKEKDNGK